MEKKILFVFLVVSYTVGFCQIPIKKSIVHIYSHENSSLPNSIHQIAEIDNGNILVNAVRPFLFDGSNFLRYDHYPEDLRNDSYTYHRLDNGLNLYTNNSFAIYERSDGSLDTLIQNINKIQPLLVFLFEQENELYFNLNNAIFKYDFRDQILYELDTKTNFNKIYSQYFYPLNAKILCANKSTQKGEFYEVDLNSKKIEKFKIPGIINDLVKIEGEKYCLSSNSLLIIEEDGNRSNYPLLTNYSPNGKIILLDEKDLLITYDDRLFIFDRIKKEWVSEIRNTYGDKIMKNDFFFDGVKDEYGNLILISNFRKIVRIQSSTDVFQSLGLNGKSLNAKKILVDTEEGLVFIGTVDGSLLVFNDENELVQTFREFLSNNGILIIEKTGSRRYVAIHSKGSLELYFDGSQMKVAKSQYCDLNSYFSNKIMEDDRMIKYFVQSSIISINKSSPTPIKIDSLPISLTGLIKQKDYFGWDQGSNTLYRFSQEFDLLRTYEFNQAGIVKYIHVQNDTSLMVGTTVGLFTLNTYKDEVAGFDEITDCIYSIVPYEDRYYCGTNDGIIEIKGGKVVKRFTLEDGIQGNEFNTNCFYQTVSGQIYFGGVNGVSYFHPDNLKSESENIKPSIRELFTNKNRYVKYTRNEKIILDHGEYNINFLISTLGPKRSHDYNNQYLVDKYSSQWIDSKKGNSINLTFSPGEYKVYYHSSSFFNPNAKKSNFIDIVVPVPWYQTNWFYSGVASLFLGGALAILYLHYKSKFRAQQKEIELRENLQQERNRISRELHDSIGVQMSIVGRNANWISENLNGLSRGQIEKSINNLHGIAEEVNQNLRDTIWASKKEIYTTTDLINRTKTFIHKLNINYSEKHFDTTDKLNASFKLSPSISLNLFRIIQEALHNAIKHSEAENIFVRFSEVDSEHWQFMVQDNGKGFDPKMIEYGNGLENMTIRAKESKLYLNIESNVNVGTRVTCKIKKADRET